MSDLIDRKAVIDAFWKLDVEIRPSVIDAITSILERLPPAQPERKTGRWLNGFCSACGKEAVTEWNDCGGERIETNFCPFCGADMRGDGNND